jgi:hypothetical protein
VKISSPGFSQLLNIWRASAATITEIARMDSTDVATQAFAQPEIAPVLQGLEPPGPPLDHPAHIQASVVQAGDQCPSCGAVLAADQRYCLECGHRRGDPRLPFMDAVVLMDAVRRPHQAPPPTPKKRRSGVSPNAALIAGVGTLLLALGTGVLIGRSGEQAASTPTQAAPIVIHCGGGEAPNAKSNAKTTIGGGAGSGSGKASKKSQATLKKEAESGAATEEVLKPAAGVKLPPPTAQPGEACKKGTAGCEHGKQTGNYFGP